MAKRNTPTKQMVRELLTVTGGAMSQDMLEEQLKGRIDRVTIYRVLAGFCEEGILHRVIGDDGKAYYALCNSCSGDKHNHEHAHFRCVDCRKIECLPFPAKPKLPAGYSLESMNFWISGRCDACVQNIPPV